ncbi:hypothetical protein D9M70_265620 [compost metagenome]
MRFGFELFPVGADIFCFQILDEGLDHRCAGALGIGVAQAFNGALVICHPRRLLLFPLRQWPAHFGLPAIEQVTHALPLGVDLLRDFLQLGDQALAEVVQGGLGARHLVGD